jgi:hypothetical protein
MVLVKATFFHIWSLDSGMIFTHAAENCSAYYNIKILNLVM